MSGSQFAPQILAKNIAERDRAGGVPDSEMFPSRDFPADGSRMHVDR